VNVQPRITLAADRAEERQSGDAIDLRHLQDFLWRRWKLIAATAIAVMAVTFVVLLTITPRYTATVQLILDPKKSQVFGAEAILPELNLDSGNVDSQISVIQSTNLLRHVVEKQKLTQDPEFGQRAAPGLFGLLTGWFSPDNSAVPAAAPKDDEAIPPDILRAITHLKQNLDVQRVNRTYVISVAVTSEDPVKAARLANAVAEVYVVDQLEARYEAARSASTWLAERIETLGDQVRQSEEAVAKFRRDNNLVSASGESKVTIGDQQLSELSEKLVTARAETAAEKSKFDQATQIQASGGDIQAIPDVVRSVAITNLRQQEAEISAKEADLVSRYSDSHPLVINARAQKRDIERSISAEVARIISNLKNDYEAAKARQDSLEASLKQASGASSLDSDVGVRLRELERTNAANKALFESFLSRSKITEEQSNFEEREARVISPATKPASPSFPKKTLVESLAFVVGLMLGAAGSVALDMLNAGFLTPRAVEEKLGVPVLAAAPLMSAKERTIDGKLLDPSRYLMARPLSRYAEAIRAMRVGVQMSDVDNPAKVVLLTSSIPSEGKTTSAISLAYSAVKAGQKVALIDCDMRHPSVTKHFRLDSQPGVVDFLTGAATTEKVFFYIDGVAVLPAGAKSQNPPDLLGSERMRQFIENMRKAFDYVVIDSPPVGPVIDARVLGSLVDKVIYVVKWGSTPREIVAQHIESFSEPRKLAGVLLTLVDEAQTPRYGPYSHYSGYYYHKYYQN
jgi:exopolysaccharide transport family protein